MENMSKKLNYKLFWSWDHSTNWVLNAPGGQNSGVANPYTKNPDVFLRDYQRAVLWAAEHGINAIGIVGLLRDRHGGVESARRLCAFAQEHGVRIYIIAGMYAYGGVYYEGDSPWNLDRFLAENPECMGRNADGSPLFWQYEGKGGAKCQAQGCSSSERLNQYVLDSLDWLFTAIPELGGIQMESGDNGVCMCEKCVARRERITGAARRGFTAISFADMGRIYPRAVDVIRSRAPKAWLICESYSHFLDKCCQEFFQPANPLPERQALLNMDSDVFWQWKADYRLADGSWTEADRLPECLRKFRHVMRAHTGTQWWYGRHTLGIDKIRRQCRLSFTSGLQGVSLFGEGAPFHANVEFNYLALDYFANNPFAPVQDFVRDVMAPRLGGNEEHAARFIELAEQSLSPRLIPDALLEIAKITSGIKEFEALRRWNWLASFLGSFHWEANQPWHEPRTEPNARRIKRSDQWDLTAPQSNDSTETPT